MGGVPPPERAVTLRPRKSPTAFSLLFAGGCLLLVSLMPLWAATPESMTIAGPFPEAADFWCAFENMSRGVAAAEGMSALLHVLDWQAENIAVTSTVLAAGGLVGREVYWRLWERLPPSQGRP